MQQPALYFPYVHIRDDEWLKAAALYWPSVRRLVPHGYAKRDSATARAFANVAVLRDEEPGHLLDSMSWDLLRVLRQNTRRLQRDYSVDRAVETWDGRPHTNHTHDVAGTPALGWIHITKFPQGMVEYLVQAGLAERGRPGGQLDRHHGPPGAWIGLHPALAGAYMTALAGQISERAHFQPLTDQDDLRVATPNSDVRAAVGLLLGREPGDEDDQVYATEGVETYVMLALQYALPRNLSDVSAEAILKCRDSLAEELSTFRAYVADQRAELAELAALPLTDRKVEAFAEHIVETVEIPLRKVEKGLSLHKLDPVRSLLVTGSVAAPVVASPLLGSPLAASAAGAASAIGGAWWRVRTIRDDSRAASPVGYILDVRDRLTPKTVAARARKFLLGTYGRTQSLPTRHVRTDAKSPDMTHAPPSVGRHRPATKSRCASDA